MKSVAEWALIAASVTALLLTCGWARADELDWGGYVKTFGMGIGGRTTGQLDWSFQSLNAVRIRASWNLAETLATEAGYEIQPVFQTESSGTALTSALPLVRGATYRLVDLPQTITSSSSFILYQNLDRLNIRWKLAYADITLGRQAVTFGSARAINPTDVLLPYSFSQVNVEYRIGVDALRVQAPVGRMGEIDVGVVVGENAQASNSAAFGRLKFSLLETDVVTMAMTFQNAYLVGGGIQRAIWMLGYWLDVAEVWGPGIPEYLRLSTGLDYTFKLGGDSLMLFTEYHYNGAGAARAQDYLTALTQFAYQKGGTFLLGRHYLIPGASYPITPLLGSHLQLITNLTDGSLFISPGIEYNIAENFYLDLGGYATLGAGLTTNALGATEVQSEFGTYPLLAYAAARWYF